MADDTRARDLPEVAVAVGYSTTAALVIALFPASLASGVVAWPIGWIAAWGPVALLVGLAAASLRLLWPLPRSVVTVSITALVTAGPLALFAELLKRVTHHRPLGAATFAVLGAVLFFVVLAFVARATREATGEGRSRLVARAALALAIVAGGLLTLGIIATALTGEAAGGLLLGLLTVLLMMGAAVAAARAPSWKWADRPGLSIGFWILASVVSIAVLGLVPASRLALAEQAPAVLPFAGWFGG